MTQITISNGTTSIEMPKTAEVTDAGSIEYREVKMAGGKITREVVGFRPAFKYAWDYIPADIVATMIAFFRTAEFFTVNYFDVDNTEKSGLFSISYPSPQIFKFEQDGTGVWHNWSITIMSQEVV